MPKSCSYESTSLGGRDEKTYIDEKKLRLDESDYGTFKGTTIYRFDLNLIWSWDRDDMLARQFDLPEGFVLPKLALQNDIVWEFDGREDIDGRNCDRLIGRPKGSIAYQHELFWFETETQHWCRRERISDNGVTMNWTNWKNIIPSQPDSSVFELPEEMEIEFRGPFGAIPQGH